MQVFFDRFGTSALVGFVIGVGLATWVETTARGVVFIVVVAMSLTIIVIELVRNIVAGLGWLGRKIWFGRPPPPTQPPKRSAKTTRESDEPS